MTDTLPALRSAITKFEWNTQETESEKRLRTAKIGNFR